MSLSENFVTSSDQWAVNRSGMYSSGQITKLFMSSLPELLGPAIGTCSVSDIAALPAWVPRRYVEKSLRQMHNGPVYYLHG